MSDDTPTIKAPKQAERGLHMHLSGTQLAPDLERVAEQLIGTHQRLRFLEDWRVAYLWDYADPDTSAKPCAWGKARLVPKWALAITEYDAAITMNLAVWQVLSEQQREALMLHELMHFGTNERTGALETVPHDIEEFGFVAATYGQWRSSLSVFAEQLGLGLRDGR